MVKDLSTAQLRIGIIFFEALSAGGFAWLVVLAADGSRVALALAAFMLYGGLLRLAK